MGNRTIFLNDVAENALENKKKINPNFSLSEAVQILLIQDDKLFDDPTELQMQINKEKSEVVLKKNNIDILEEKLRRLINTIEQRKIEEEEKRANVEKRRNDKLKIFVGNFMEFFKVDYSTACELAEEYYPIHETDKTTIFEFMQEKKILAVSNENKEKEVKTP